MLKRFYRQIVAILTVLMLLPGLFAVPAEEYVEYSDGLSVWNLRSTPASLEDYAETSNVTANFYIYIGDSWHKVHTEYKLYKVVANGNRYAVSASQLETAYGDYGFDAEDFRGESERRFGYENSGRFGTIWADVEPVQLNGEWMLPLSVRDVKSYDVYYLPNNTETLNGAHLSSVQGANSFSRVTLSEYNTANTTEFVIVSTTPLREWIAGMTGETLDGWQKSVDKYTWFVDSSFNTELTDEMTAADFRTIYGRIQQVDITLVDADGNVLGVVTEERYGMLLADWLKESDALELNNGKTVHHYTWELPNDTAITTQTLSQAVTVIGTEKPVYTITFIDNAADSEEKGGSFINGDAAHTTIDVLQGDCVPAEFLAGMSTNIALNEGFAFVEWRYLGNDGYLVLDNRTSVIADTVVWAHYTQKVYVRFWKDRSMAEMFDGTGREEQPVGKLYEGILPAAADILSAAPAEGMRFRYWLDLNTGEVFTPGIDKVKGNLDLYPVFERAIFEFKDSDGNTLEALYEGTELLYDAPEKEGYYYAGFRVQCGDSDTMLIAPETKISWEYIEENDIVYSGPENGRYTITAETVYYQQRNVVYHTGGDAEFIIFGATASDEYSVVVNDNVVLLGALDIVNNVSPIGLALKGWSLTEGSDEIDFEPNAAFAGEEELNQLVASGGTVHLYPVWAKKDDTIAITFNSNYPEGVVDSEGNPLVDKTYTVYIKIGSMPTMPTMAKTGIEKPANLAEKDGEYVPRYLMAGWSLTTDGVVGDPSDENTQKNGTYVEGSQYMKALNADTTFNAIWIDTEPAITPTSAKFHIRIDGTLPLEPGQQPSSGYLPGTCGTGSWDGTIKKQMNVVNNVPEVEANIDEEPDIGIILNKLQDTNNNYHNIFPEIMDATVENYGEYWWIDWYACKLVNCPPYGYHYHVDGRVRFANQVELNYHPNGGFDVPVGSVHTKDTVADVDFSKIPKRENFIFMGWDEDPAAKIPDFTAGGTLKYMFMDADKDLYAIWQPEKITIPMDKDFTGQKFEQTNDEAPTWPKNGRTYQFTIEAISLPEGAAYAKRTVTSAADGSFSFPQIDVPVAGMYVFEVREVIGSLPVQYDTSVYRLTVNIVESDYGLGIAGYSFTRNNEMIAVDGNKVDNVVFEFTNRTDVRTVTAVKRWNDGDDQDGIRPDSVTVTIKRRGDNVFAERGDLTRAAGWTYTWEGLPIKDPSSGLIYEYYIEEDAVAGYTAAYSGDMNSGLTVTNTHVPLMTNLSVVKAWRDNNNAEGYRPDAIEYTVTGRTPDDSVVLIRRSGDVAAPWRYTFIDLPVYYRGEHINYTVTESEVSGYTSAVESVGSGSSGNPVVRVTNTLQVKSVTVTKYVEGNAAHRDADFNFTAKVYDADGSPVSDIPSGTGYTVDPDGIIRFALSHGESVKLDMLPKEGYIVVNEECGSYSPVWSAGGIETPDGMKYSIAETSALSVTNHRSMDISTGVKLDAAPYILLSAIAFAGIALRRRKRRNV